MTNENPTVGTLIVFYLGVILTVAALWRLAGWEFTMLIAGLLLVLGSTKLGATEDDDE